MAQKKDNGCGCFLFILLAAGGAWYWYNDSDSLPQTASSSESNEVPVQILTSEVSEEEDSSSQVSAEAPASEQTSAEAQDAEKDTKVPHVANNDAATFLPPLHVVLRNSEPGILGEITAIRALIAHLDKAEMAKALEANGILPDNYLDAMIDAIKAGDSDLVIRLLACGTPTDKLDSNYTSAHWLLMSKNDLTPEIIKIVAAADIVEPDKADENGFTVLIEAANPQISPTTLEVLKALGCSYGNKLQTAAIYGDIEAATAALNEGISINDGGEHNMTPLLLSVCNRDTAMLEFLLSKGADTSLAVGPKQWTIAQAAVERRNVAALKVLIKANVEINKLGNDKPGNPILAACVRESSQECILPLIEAGADVNAADESGNTALHRMGRNMYNEQSVKIVETLIAKGADVHKQNDQGYTPLLTLASYLQDAYSAEPQRDKQATINALNLLLKAGADPHMAHAPRNARCDLKGYDGPVNALKYAELCSATECIEILKQACANTKPSIASRLSGSISVEDAISMLEKYELLKTYSLTVTNPFFVDMAHKEASDLECAMVAAVLKTPPPCYYKRRVKEFCKHCKMLQDKMEGINDYAYLSAIYTLSDWVTTYANTTPDKQILEKATLAFIAAGHDINKISGKAEDKVLFTNSETPLITAARRNNHDMVRLLLELGANPNLTNGNGATARSIARENNMTHVLKVLDELAPAPEPQPQPEVEQKSEATNTEETSDSQPATPAEQSANAGKSVSAPAQEEVSASDDNQASAALFDENGVPTEETVNNVVTKRFGLMATSGVTIEAFQDVFADQVIELKSSKEVSVTTLYEKAHAQNEKWPSRAIKLIDMGVSGQRIEANVALVYKNAKNGKSISAYNKVVLLLNKDGKICGMSETISSKRSKLSKKFKAVKFTGEDPVFAVSE